MKRLLWIILALAAIIRIVGISDYPTGFTADEASFGYDAYSLLKTGKDQWGESWPLTLRSFGDSKLPLYTYLTIPSVAVFGLSEFSTRLPGAIVGVLAVYAVYLMVGKLFKSKKLSLLAAFFLTLSPWHIMLSRGAFEANLTVFFMSMGVYLFLRGLRDYKWMMLSFFFFGLNLFTYHSARLVTPLIMLLLVCFYREELGIKRVKDLLGFLKRHWRAVLIFAIFLASSILEVLHGGSSRAADVTIFNPTDKWAAVADRRYEAVLAGIGTSIARIFSNKGIYLFDRFVSNYATYLSPQFLFTEGVNGHTYGMINGRGVLYLYEVLFIFTSLWVLAKKGIKKSRPLFFILSWIFISIIPAAFTKGSGYAGNRAAVMMPAIQVFSAFGALTLWQLLKEKITKRRLYGWAKLGIGAAAFVFFAFFLEDYIYHTSKIAPSMLYGRKEVVEKIGELEDNYETVIVSRTLSEPQIFFAFYTQMNPAFYQSETPPWLEYQEQNLPFLDMLGEYSLGKYVFKNIDYLVDKRAINTLVVGKPAEFPHDIASLETIYYPDNTPALLLVDPASD